MGIPDHLTCLLRNLYAGQEATVRTGHATIDWFQIGDGVRPGCILSLCLFNLYVEYIMQNARLDEAQAGFKIVRKNINNLRYADDIGTACQLGMLFYFALPKEAESRTAQLELVYYLSGICSANSTLLDISALYLNVRENSFQSQGFMLYIKIRIL